MTLQPRPFEKIRDGIKTIELRLNDEKRQKIQIGDEIVFSHATDPSQTVVTRVESLHPFRTFKESYDALGPSAHGNSNAEGYRGMYQYYSPEDEARHGVLAIQIRREAE